MNIRLRPELEELIKQDVERGPYESVDEFVEHAVSLLHEQEAWLADHTAEIGVNDADQARAALEEKKRAWADKREIRG
jgi:Arc/MetJ-type ribon-helix-helix transcriptional regulator